MPVWPSPLLTLFGAYTLLTEPLTPRPLVVELRALTALASLFGGVATFQARVVAEDLSGATPATVGFTARPPGVRCHVTFGDGPHATYELLLDTRFDRRIVRSLTELSGLVIGPEGAVIGSARLRLNWRTGA